MAAAGYVHEAVAQGQTTEPREPTESRSSAPAQHPTGTLTGVVVGPAGAPMAGITVFNVGDAARPTQTFGYGGLWQRGGRDAEAIECLTDEAGHFELTGLREGQAYAFARAEGYRLSGVRAATGTDELRLVMYPENAPAPQRPARPPVTDTERDRRLAEQVALEGLGALTDDRRRPWERLMTALARVSPELAGAHLTASDSAPYATRRVRAAILEASDAGGAVDAVWGIESPHVRCRALLDVAARLSEPRPDHAAQALDLVITTADATPSDTGYYLKYKLRALDSLYRLGHTEVETTLRAAVKAAEEVPIGRWSGVYARGYAAAAMCAIDSDRAVALMDKLSSEDSRARAYYIDQLCVEVACRVAERDPARGEALFDRWELYDRLKGAWVIAQQDAERALAFARRISATPHRCVALGYVAQAVAKTDRERAFSIIDEAARVEVEGKVPRGYRWLQAAALARLGRIAQQIGYPDIEGLAMRAMSQREFVPLPMGTYWNKCESPGYVRARLARSVAWVDTEAARHLLEPAVERITAYLSREDCGRNILAALVLADPEWALEVVRSIAIPGTGRERSRKLQVSAYGMLAECLSIPAEERIARFGDESFWAPGKDE